MSKLSPKDYEYRRDVGSVTSINYHFIFVPKRRKAVLVNGVDQRLQEIVWDVAKEHGWKITAMEIMPDHIHIFLNAPPKEAPSDIARWIKGRASRILREEFPRLRKLPSMWTKTYFCSTTGQVSTAVVKQYIENQKGN